MTARTGMTERLIYLHPHWKRTRIAPDASLKEAIEIIDRAALQIGLVVDETDRLLGVLTDGDIRRALIRRGTLDVPVRQVMNTRPVTLPVHASDEMLRRTMVQRGVHQIPLLDEQGRVVGLKTLRALLESPRRDNWVLLMAGGFGTRLYPLTARTPKPLLPVGGKPILEHILERFLAAGFHRFYISVHYRAEMIRRHFGDGRRWQAEIRYLEETEPLGTAGCLQLLPEVPEQPMILMNGDLLTQVDFGRLLAFHEEEAATATLCVREYTQQIPFGVVEMAEGRMTGIVEKPVHHWFVNAGIYVLSPDFIRRTPPGVQQVPDLLQQAVQRGEKVAVFPIHEYWMDIGRPDDFQRAQEAVLRMTG